MPKQASTDRPAYRFTIDLRANRIHERLAALSLRLSRETGQHVTATGIVRQILDDNLPSASELGLSEGASDGKTNDRNVA